MPTRIYRIPKQSRAQDTTQSIVTAAEQLLVELGYANASTNAIARRADVSVGSLYQYFPDKAAVFRAVVRRHRDEVKPLICKSLTHIVADSNGDIVEYVLDLLRDMARTNARNPELMARMVSELGWLGHDADGDLDIPAIVREVIGTRYDVPKRELDVIAQLMVMTVSQLSR